MTAPIRSMIHALTEFPKEPAEMTLREALEWHKRAVRTLTGEVLRPLEHKELNERWVHLIGVLAEREGVPTGSLSYFLGELAQAEMNLADIADAEAKAAGV